MNKKIIFILILISCISLFLNIYKKNVSPPCFNADEAAFGYNAYSIFKTGGDEYGSFLPLRLKSFGDFKMPLYSYLSAPIVGLFGLNENSTRFLNTLISILFPFVIFLLTYELFKNKKVALLASFFISVSVGLEIVGRHAHEAYLASFLISLATIFLIKTIKKLSLKNSIIFSILTFLSLFSYQASRIYAIYFLLILIIYFAANKIKKWSILMIFVVMLGLFLITDIIYKPMRVANLLIFNNGGFQLKVQELKIEGGIKLLNNALTNGARDIVLKYFEYFSPQFLLLNGDANPRFGLIGLSLLTPIEYVFIFIGIYYLFKNKEKFRFLLLGLFLISPLSASLAWTDLSVTRSLFLIIPSLILASYGIFNLLHSIEQKKYYLLTLLMLTLGFIFFLAYNWNFYLFHYPKRTLVTQAWQCGYKELASYITFKYNSTDNFYITKKHGQPYIFLLFYNRYPPNIYQKKAQLSPPDEYGFGQVNSFDKFVFDFKIPKDQKKYISIGYPDDFTSLPEKEAIPQSQIKKIKFNNLDVFWIYEKN